MPGGPPSGVQSGGPTGAVPAPSRQAPSYTPPAQTTSTAPAAPAPTYTPPAQPAPTYTPPAQPAPVAAAPVYGQVQSELDVLRTYFAAVDLDNSGHIDSEELAAALSNYGYTFNTQTTGLMIRMHDRTGSGTISFEEFQGVHKFILACQTAFGSSDRDQSGTIDVSELYTATQAAGFTFTAQTFQVIQRRLDQGMYSKGSVLTFPQVRPFVLMLKILRR